MRDDASPQGRVEFERLYSTYASTVRGHLAYLTGDRALAEDLTQETFGKLYERESADGGAGLSNPQAWLLTVASNLAYNHFRSESRRAAREAAPGVALGSEASSTSDVDDVLDVRRALAHLESRDRVVLMLRHSGFAYAEIAQAVGVAPGSVGTILARAQARFRTVYEGARRGVAEKE